MHVLKYYISLIVTALIAMLINPEVLTDNYVISVPKIVERPAIFFLQSTPTPISISTNTPEIIIIFEPTSTPVFIYDNNDYVDAHTTPDSNTFYDKNVDISNFTNKSLRVKATNISTPTNTNIPTTATWTSLPSTATSSPTNTSTLTSTPSSTSTLAPTPTNTRKPRNTNTPSPTSTPTASQTSTPTLIPTPSPTRGGTIPQPTDNGTIPQPTYVYPGGTLPEVPNGTLPDIPLYDSGVISDVTNIISVGYNIFMFRR
ncbi:MAG: hypothetical protein KC414_02300 [Romboutsia sp.]|nr:hypothetical protein [Romboutsia sp.]